MTRSCSERFKLPESTGDKLTAWRDDSNFLGEAGLDSSGEVLNHAGEEVIPFEYCDTAGEQSLDQDCRGCSLRIYAAGEYRDLLEDTQFP